MKNFKTIATLICVLASLSLTAQNINNKSFDPLHQGCWTLGLNGGFAYQTSDVKSNGGYGLGATLAKNLYYKPGALLSFDVRGRLKYAKTNGLDTQRSYDIDNNTTLNGTSTNLDYTQYPTNTNITKGFVFQNYQNHLLELGLEGVIGFNRLAEEKNILLNIYGGIGLDYNITYIDQFNTNKNQDYTTEYASLDLTQNTTSIKNQLQTEILDGDYETVADGYDDSGNLTFMPNIGFELGYQVTPRFAIGVGHKLTFSRKDNLDGHKWENASQDLHHYTNAFLKFKIKDGEIDMPLPVVEITKPYYSPYTTDNEVTNVIATIKHINSSMDVLCVVNGKEVPFNYNEGALNAHTRLRPGKNNIKVTAQNLKGKAFDDVVIILKPYENPNKPASCEWIIPQKNNAISNISHYTAIAKVSHVNRDEISIRINDRHVSDFRLKNGKVEVATNLRYGSNKFDIEVANNYGSDRDVITIVFEEPKRLPEIDITTPRDNFNTTQDVINFKAKAKNVEHQGDITFTVNGKRIYDFNFDGQNITTSLRLIEGKNIIHVRVNNQDGQDQDEISVNRDIIIVKKRPTVRITSFKTTNDLTGSCQTQFSAKTTNIKGKGDISMIFNGKKLYNYSFNKMTHVISANLDLRQGQNNIEVTVDTKGGTDSDRASQNCIIDTPKQPEVTFIIPQDYSSSTKFDYKDIKVQVLEADKRDITLQVNGQNITFNFNNHILSTQVHLKEGKNIIKVIATNQFGSADAERSITYLKKLTLQIKPKVNITSPQNNLTTTTSNVRVTAKVKAVKTKNDVKIKVGNKLITQFSFNKIANKISFNAILNNGNNKIWIEVKNNDGKDVDQINITYNKISPPKVTIIKPTNNFNTKQNNVELSAQLSHISQTDDITVKLNNKTVAYNYNHNTGVLTANLKLVEGHNFVIVKAQNQTGNAQDDVNVNYIIVKKPIVDILKPTNNIKVTESKVSLRANTKYADKIKIFINGIESFKFTNLKGRIKAEINLIEGKNKIVVQAINTAGLSKDEVFVFFNRIKILPIIKIVNPKKDGSIVKKSLFNLKAQIKNATKKDIKLTLNGRSVSKFSIGSKNGNLIAGLKLKLGRNLIKIEAKNKDGSVTEQTNIIYKSSIIEQKPTIEIISISIPIQNPFEPGILKSSILANTTHISTKSQIELKVNNEVITEFNFDTTSGLISYTFVIIQGVNTVDIKVTNSAGTSFDHGEIGHTNSNDNFQPRKPKRNKR